MTDGQLIEAVEFWFGQESRSLPPDERAVQMATMKLAVERLGTSHLAGAKAQVWLIRWDAVALISQKVRLSLMLGHAQESGASEEELAEMESRLRPLEKQVEEIKLVCTAAERNLRDVTIRWLAGE